MNEDGCTLDVPTTGGEGKSAVVVGGGISGLTSAHYLLRAGYKVVLLEGRESVGGNNEPYIDGANQEHATTCVFTQPSQQPHYAELCRNFGVAQVSHSMENVEGVVILDGRPIPVRMGGASSYPQLFWRIVRDTFPLLTWAELMDGFKIYSLLYSAYQLQPESSQTVAELLGPRLASCPMFRDFFMGWVGVNVWCRFTDLDDFPAHVFAAFIFEYSVPLKRREGGEQHVCVLDGRLIRALEASNKAKGASYEQHQQTKAVGIRRAKASGKKLVTARRSGVYHRKAASVIASLFGSDATAKTEIGSEDDELTFECDVVILATQPQAALAILTSSSAAFTDQEQGLIPPQIPASLPAEVAKWSEMECFTFLHCDKAMGKGREWVHETLHHSKTRQPYAHYAIHPRVGDTGSKYWISYIYGRECARDFIEAGHVAAESVIEVLTPRLPVFTGANCANRNEIWRRIDLECSDVYWTHCCRSGLQFHNNGILCAKRVVRAVLGSGW